MLYNWQALTAPCTIITCEAVLEFKTLCSKPRRVRVSVWTHCALSSTDAGISTVFLLLFVFFLCFFLFSAIVGKNVQIFPMLLVKTSYFFAAVQQCADRSVNCTSTQKGCEFNSSLRQE